MNNTNFSETSINQNGEKLFTQSDVNRIISERLSRDKLKASDDLEKREKELSERELKLTAKQLLTEKGLPAELAEILKLETEETVAQNINLLSELFNLNKNTQKNNLKVWNEKTLPTGKREDDSELKLRKAFGLA